MFFAQRGTSVTLEDVLPFFECFPLPTTRKTQTQSHVLRLWHLGDLANRCAPEALSKAKQELGLASIAQDPMDNMVSAGEY
jgi:hypothetical protein